MMGQEPPWTKVRKKPLVVEAYQWFGDEDRYVRLTGRDAIGRKTGEVKTLEGPHTVTEGYWIIRGVKGEIYGCEEQIFNHTYDIIENEEIVEIPKGPAP